MRRRTASDDNLIRSAAQGDAPSFAELHRRHRRWVVRLLLSFTHEPEEAEDLAQEVFTRMYRHAGSYRTTKPGSSGFTVWLRRIAVNVGNSYLQRREPTALVPMAMLEETQAKGSTDPVLAVLERSLHEDIRAAIAELPEDQREALLLRCFLGLSVPEIARRQDCPEGTVKSRLSYGLRRVRTLLSEIHGPEA